MLEYITPLPIILVAGTYHTLVHVVGIESGRLIAMWIVPQVLSSVQLFGTYLPHRPTQPYQGEGLLKARSNSYPQWLSLITCYHFGYHFEHHYAPLCPLVVSSSIPFSAQSSSRGTKPEKNNVFLCKAPFAVWIPVETYLPRIFRLHLLRKTSRLILKSSA